MKAMGIGRWRTLALLFGAALLAAVMASGAMTATASADPAYKLDVTQTPDKVPEGGRGLYTVAVTNSGASETTGEVKVEFVVPEGFKIDKASSEPFVIGSEVLFLWSCSIAPDSRSATCQGPAFGLTIPPGEEACKAVKISCRLKFLVREDASVEPGALATIEACEGGAPSCTTDSIPIVTGPASLRVVKFDGRVLQENGAPATQAGSHPFTAETEFELNNVVEADENITPSEALKDVRVDLPPGFVGNPNETIIGHCSAAQLTAGTVALCPPESQVGIVHVKFSAMVRVLPVYNVERIPGNAATFGFTFSGVATMITVGIRSGTDYGLRTVVKNNPISLPIAGVKLTLWGVPADPEHDVLRGRCMDQNGNAEVKEGCPLASTLPERAFLSLPTSCSEEQRTDISITSWEGGEASSSFLSHDNTQPIPVRIGTDGCNALEFEPTIEARPTTNVADAPTGLSFKIHVPQNLEPKATSTAHLRDAAVELPEGLVLNPAAANGLGSCSPSDIGLLSGVGETPVTFTPDPATCPNNSKLGLVEINSPLQDHVLPGALYLARPYDNPFGSLVAIYMAVHDPISGVVIKSPGRIDLDPVAGQVTTVFEDNPQLPFEDLDFKFFGGPTAALRTPASCGIYTTTSTLTPWSAPESGVPPMPSDSYAIQNPAAGQRTCPNSDAERPHKPGFEAGTDSPVAGTDSSLVVNLRREDGTQQFSSVKLSPPPGLIGKLAGIPYCPEDALAAAEAKSGAEENASPSCPSAAQIGTVTAGAGAGQAPFYAHGKAFLTGPYKGAPVGMAIVTPAVAGPFDLGTIVVRNALFVDRKTAQITAVSDPIPSILKGIQLNVRTVSVRLDRSGFTRNPTSCDLMSFSGELVSTLSQVAPLSNRFQLGECDRLGFRPRLALSLKGGLKRRGHPSLRAVLTTRAGDANIASASVALPANELLDQKNIGTVCTRVQFDLGACPPQSVYGFARVSTPLLDHQLSGPVYLRSSSNKLPDLVPDLRGPAFQPLRLEAAGRTDMVKGGLRNSFEFVPDAPFSKLVLTLQGGPKGLLVNAKDVCEIRSLRASVNLEAHNGLYREIHPRIRTKCSTKKAKGSASRRGDGERRNNQGGS